MLAYSFPTYPITYNPSSHPGTESTIQSGSQPDSDLLAALIHHVFSSSNNHNLQTFYPAAAQTSPGSSQQEQNRYNKKGSMQWLVAA